MSDQSASMSPREWLGHRLRVSARIGARADTSGVDDNRWFSVDGSLSLIRYSSGPAWSRWEANVAVTDEKGVTHHRSRGETAARAMAACEARIADWHGTQMLSDLQKKGGS
jgi:hypothetical protein